MDGNQKNNELFDVEIDGYTVSDELGRNESIDLEHRKVVEKHKKSHKKNNEMKSTKKKRKNTLLKATAILLVLMLIASTPFIWLFAKYRMLDDKIYQINPEIEEFEHEPIVADDEIDSNLLDTAIWHHKDVINVLLAGCDYGDTEHYYPRSDAMIIASINKRSGTVYFVSLSRATYVAIEGHNNSLLNRAYTFGGPEMLIKTIETNYKIKIDDFVSVDFAGFTSLVDVMGGVDVYLSADEAAAIKIGTEAGNYHLNGEYSLEFARVRSIDTDRDRTGRQREIMIALTKKIMKLSSVSAFSDLLDRILPFVTTDLKYWNIIGYVKDALTHNYFGFDIEQAVVPTGYVPLTRVGKMDVLIVDWNSIKSDIHGMLYPGLENEVLETISEEIEKE